MIFEKLPGASVDAEKLVEYFRRVVHPLTPVMNIPAFGGWSILSSTGEYTDGWQPGHLCYKANPDGTLYYDHELASKIGFKPADAHAIPTQVCTEYVAEVVAQIRQLGLSPCRARWTVLRSHSRGTVHRDAPDNRYAVRLHIPVITTPECLFLSQGESGHAPADGSLYLVKVNRPHQIVNGSDIDRIHIIMDVTDRSGLSSFHQLRPLDSKN